jgi:hypothetical protein
MRFDAMIVTGRTTALVMAATGLCCLVAACITITKGGLSGRPVPTDPVVVATMSDDAICGTYVCTGRASTAMWQEMAKRYRNGMTSCNEIKYSCTTSDLSQRTPGYTIPISAQGGGSPTVAKTTAISSTPPDAAVAEAFSTPSPAPSPASSHPVQSSSPAKAQSVASAKASAAKTSAGSSPAGAKNSAGASYGSVKSSESAVALAANDSPSISDTVTFINEKFALCAGPRSESKGMGRTYVEQRLTTISVESGILTTTERSHSKVIYDNIVSMISRPDFNKIELDAVSRLISTARLSDLTVDLTTSQTSIR